MPSSTRQYLSLHGATIALLTILLVGAALRLSAIGFDLPAVYHPDEDALVMPAMNILKTGDWNPLRMDYGSLVIYLQVPVMALVYLLTARTGVITTPTALNIMERGAFPGIFPHPEYVLAGRLLSAAFGIATIVFVYMLGTRLGGRRLGLIAAALAALTPDLVVHSHYATADGIMVSLSTLAIYLIVRAYDDWETDSPWPYVAAGFVCGLAMAAKLQGALLIVPLLLAALLRVRTLDEVLSGRVVGGILAMGFGFLLVTPYAVLDTPKYLEFASLVLSIYAQAGREVQGTTWAWQLDTWFTGRNALLMVAAIPGFVLSWPRWGKRAFLVNSFPILVALVALTSPARQSRTWLPMAPIVCLWAALALAWALDYLGRRVSPSHSYRSGLAVVVLAVISLPLLFNTISGNRNLAGDDVRTEVQHWLEQNVTPGDGVAFDRFRPNIDPSIWPVTLVFGHYGRDLDWYASRGVRYVVASDVIHNDVGMSPEEAAGHAKLTAQMCLVKQFTGPFLAANDRTYWIYQLPPCEPAAIP